MNTQKIKKRLGALDVFIIIAVIACAVCVGLRYFTLHESAVGTNTQLDEYILSFRINNIRGSSAEKFMKKGLNLYMQEGDGYLGTLRSIETVDPASKYYTLPDGSVERFYNTAEDDERYRVDVQGSITVNGYRDEAGRFCLNGNTYLGVNKELQVYSKYLFTTILITDITKAQ